MTWSAWIPARDQMETLYRKLGGEVSVYTLDQRGTGQSTRLACNASSSPSSSSAVADASGQLRKCLQSLSDQYTGNLGAFSITSAAHDLVTLISQTQTDSDVMVYGLGYGTLVVERLLHFGVAEIKGYVLDGSVTASSSNLSQFAYVSQSDAAFGDVGDAFLRVCENDFQCSARFQGGGGSKSVSETLKEVLDRIDDSQCASLWRENGDSTRASAHPASFNVRRTLAMLMQNATERALIPLVVYRLHRCSAQDQVVLKNLVTRLQGRERELASHSELVYDLQVFSELWEAGSLLPTQSTMTARFTQALIGPGRVFDQVPKYCVFAGDTTSEACAGLDSSIIGDNKSVTTPRFTYARDQYWNAAATIPAHASVLLLTSSLDGQAPLKNAALLAEALQGSAKALLTFDSGARGVLTASLQDTSDVTSSCGLEILSSYIRSNGALDVLNTSCMNQMVPVSFAITEAMSMQLLNVTDGYDDGSTLDSTSSFTPSSAATSVDGGSAPSPSTLEKDISSLKSSRNRYRAAFIVVVGLLAFVVLVALAALYLWWKQRKNKDLRHEEDELRRMCGDATNDVELLRQIYMSSPEVWSNADARFGNDRRSAGSNVAQKHANAQRGSIYSEYDGDEEEETKPPAPPISRTWVYRSNHLQL